MLGVNQSWGRWGGPAISQRSSLNWTLTRRCHYRLHVLQRQFLEKSQYTQYIGWEYLANIQLHKKMNNVPAFALQTVSASHVTPCLFNISTILQHITLRQVNQVALSRANPYCVQARLTPELQFVWPRYAATAREQRFAMTQSNACVVLRRDVGSKGGNSVPEVWGGATFMLQRGTEEPASCECALSVSLKLQPPASRGCCSTLSSPTSSIPDAIVYDTLLLLKLPGDIFVCCNWLQPKGLFSERRHKEFHAYLCWWNEEVVYPHLIEKWLWWLLIIKKKKKMRRNFAVKIFGCDSSTAKEMSSVES